MFPVKMAGVDDVMGGKILEYEQKIFCVKAKKLGPKPQLKECIRKRCLWKK